jgi:hypothetical protein
MLNKNNINMCCCMSSSGLGQIMHKVNRRVQKFKLNF